MTRPGPYGDLAWSFNFFFFEIFEFPERKVTFANPVPHYVIS